eukprot:2947898-Rhodomonas_salina.3
MPGPGLRIPFPRTVSSVARRKSVDVPAKRSETKMHTQTTVDFRENPVRNLMLLIRRSHNMSHAGLT